ncbi:hypothetical protein Ancab_003197 [Ancistrocladus abbreviatus]
MASLLKSSSVLDKTEWVEVKCYLWKASGLDYTEANPQAYRTLLVTAPGLGQYILGAIQYEETLYQSTTDGRKMVDVLVEQNIIPGIKVGKAYCCKHSQLAICSCCEGSSPGASLLCCHFSGRSFKLENLMLYCYTCCLAPEEEKGVDGMNLIMQDNGLVPIVEPEILLDRGHGIDRTFEVAQKVWAEVFNYLVENSVMFEGILLKPSTITPGAECKDKATPEQVAHTPSSSFNGRFLLLFLKSW